MPTTFETLNRLFRERILVLDGAMGTMIQSLKLGENDFRGARFADHPRELKGCNDLLSLTRPEVDRGDPPQVPRRRRGHHRDQHVQRAGGLARRLRHGVALVRDEPRRGRDRGPGRAERDRGRSAKPRFVAGALGPTNRTASLSPDVENPAFRAITFDQIAAAYKEQARGLLDGGVDLLLPETTFDTLNLKAALFAIQTLFEERGRSVPVIASLTITDQSGRTLSGQTLEAAWLSISHAPLIATGLNCALGRRADGARSSKTFSAPRRCRSPAIRTPAFRTRSEATTRPPRRWRRPWASSRAGLDQHRRRLLRHDAGVHRGDRGSGRKARVRTSRSSASRSRSFRDSSL